MIFKLKEQKDKFIEKVYQEGMKEMNGKTAFSRLFKKIYGFSPNYKEFNSLLKK